MDARREMFGLFARANFHYSSEVDALRVAPMSRNTSENQRGSERGVAGYVARSDWVDRQAEIKVQGLKVTAGWPSDRGDDEVADDAE
jgi:hypothetical protein